MGGLLPLMLIRLGVLPRVVSLDALVPLGLVGVLMPAVAATALTARAEGRSAVLRLVRGLSRWRLGRWWIPILLLQPALLLATAALHGSLGGDPIEVESGLSVASLVASALFLFIAASGEELGWRGVALPALQARVGALVASVVLALVTATWHLPYWILQGALAERGAGYVAVDYLFFVALTFQLTWLFNGTGGSVLAAVAFHVSFNVVNVAVLPVTASTAAFTVLTAVEGLVVLVLVRRLAPGVSSGTGFVPGRPGTTRSHARLRPRSTEEAVMAVGPRVRDAARAGHRTRRSEGSS